MKSFVILIRGINVGGKNKVPMAELRQCLKELGFSNVSTYIASGNVLLQSGKSAREVKAQIEKALPSNFKLDSKLVKVLVLTRDQLKAMIDEKPSGFGEHPDTYHSDAIFLMDVGVSQALSAFSPKEGVDAIWPGDGVIYSQRLSALRTKSHLSRVMGTPVYQSMTIRTWNTTTKLLALLDQLQKSSADTTSNDSVQQ
ncbi:MAG TPA: DUF1697 domain-containing protein [Candidatus Saccharimonadales bacterium]|nr:DUF1697 domain-containing protein [Candidatus Saccharimonadales bacterium]